MWITLILGLIANLPELIEGFKKLIDMIRSLKSRKERAARRKEAVRLAMETCRGSKSPDQCKVDLEALYQKVAYKVSKQGPDDFFEGDPDAEGEL